MEDYSKYSRKDLRSPDSIANQIIFIRQYPDNQSHSFLIVEGDTDRTFFKTFVDKDKCHITVAYNKSTAIEVLSILEKDSFPGILAVVDADFDVLEGKLSQSQNLLFTDTHDLETMIMQSPALEKILNTFGSEEKISDITQKAGKEIRAMLLECSLPIGYLRWVSLRENLSLKFEDLDFAQFTERGTLHIDISGFIQTVRNKSQRYDITDAYLRESIQIVESHAHDPWQICCGHDLVCVLSIGLRRAIGTWNAADVKPDAPERDLRLAFEHSHFYKTQLYMSILQWEKMNTPFVVLAPDL